VATDHVIESFRNAMWPGYKTGEGIEPELFAQFPLLEETLSNLGFVVWPMVAFEADDALAAAAAKAAEDPRVERVIICTPDNQEWLFALGNAWFWVGYTHWQKGDLAAAVAPMNEYLKAAERLVSLAPEKAEWRLEQGYALANLGSLAFAMGDSDLAIRHFEASNRVAEGLIATAPADVGVLRNRIENYSWLGRIREKRGELRDSVALYARSLEFATELLALQPDDRRIQEDEVLRRKLYANVLRLTGGRPCLVCSRVTGLRLRLASRAALRSMNPCSISWRMLRPTISAAATW
jgi:tetratricopeptide (TPR) repeat protein